jgi:hypothetical protein
MIVRPEHAARSTDFVARCIAIVGSLFGHFGCAASGVRLRSIDLFCCAGFLSRSQIGNKLLQHAPAGADIAVTDRLDRFRRQHTGHRFSIAAQSKHSADDGFAKLAVAVAERERDIERTMNEPGGMIRFT